VAYGKAHGLVVRDTKGQDFKGTRDRVRNETDAWFQSQGYADRQDFRRRAPKEAPERAAAAQERKDRTGSTDSSGTSERLKAIASRHVTG